MAHMVKESTYNVGDLGSIPGLGRCPREGKGYPLLYSGLENSMDYTVAKSRKESGTTERLFHFYCGPGLVGTEMPGDFP